ncbi:membrane protein insertase YidC [Vallicoccus soli]|uniref:Membrane protein insertase YidC n=2 Tax=Vallicoccus soli TaxID=2339232 RepID=A0A3A3ZHX7_9ACTN|nr:membrane protein insertase YidC [Vallicoccus soli]
MVQFHSLFTALGLDPAGGASWTLSIVGLVIVIRILLIPLFVKQIRSQRGMQLLQPKIKELQQKYKNDRERQSQEMLKLYRETGTNPLASCLPILLQAPIFFALFRVLNGVANDNALGAMTQDLVDSAADATIFGAQISDTFLRADGTSTQVVAAVLIVLMSAAMFFTQRQLMTKNMPAASLEGPFAQQQKILLYLFPAIFLVTGINFPIGVLIYWTTTNIWSMFQQLYVIARMPAPGSLAEQRFNERKAKRSGAAGTGAAVVPTGSGTTTAADAGSAPDAGQVQRGQRVQPRRTTKGKRQPGGARKAPSGPRTKGR